MSVIIGSKNSNDISERHFPHPTPVGKILPLSWNSCIPFHEYVHFQNVTENFLVKRVFNAFCNGGGFSPSSPWNFQFQNNYFNLKNIIRAPWLVKNLSFLAPVNPWKFENVLRFNRRNWNLSSMLIIRELFALLYKSTHVLKSS